MTSKSRLKYSVDSLNRLNVQKIGVRGKMLERPVAIPGRFELATHHQLRYRFNPLPKSLKELGFDPQVTEKIFGGRWSLDPDHTLRLRLKDSPDELVLRTSFLSAEAYRLVFSVTTVNPALGQSTRLFQFEGRWQADEKNRLTFVLTRREAERDRLVFEGRWRVGRRHEIIYRYAADELKAGPKKTQTLILRGSWELREKGYLTFLVEGASDSQFRFRAEFASGSSLKSRLSELRFRVGIEFSGTRQEVFQTVKLFGRLKVLGPLELGFEMTYEEGRTQEIRWLAGYKLRGKGAIDLELFNRQREGLGIQMTLAKKILGDRAALFLRAKASEREKAVEGGIKIKW